MYVVFRFWCKGWFWSSKLGQTIRAFIEMVSCSYLNVQIFISLAISSIKHLPVDPEGNKNIDFLQWTTVVYTSSNLFFITSLSAFQIFSSTTVAFVIGKTAVDVVSITFGSIIDFFLHTRVCRFSRRDVLNYALHLAHCSGD